MNIIAASAAADIMGVSLNVKMVFENDTEGPVLFDFWAAWCGPCRMMSPVVAELAEQCEGKAKICKVNVDEEPELAAAFKVMSIPMFAVIKNGQVTGSLIGARPKEEYKDGHIEGSINIPLQNIYSVQTVIADFDKSIFVHCLSGASILKSMGYKNVENIGGISAYCGEIVR